MGQGTQIPASPVSRIERRRNTFSNTFAFARTSSWELSGCRHACIAVHGCTLRFRRSFRHTGTRQQSSSCSRRVSQRSQAGRRPGIHSEVIVGRPSRSRAGLTPSYHGNPELSAPDFAVATEYGSDMWTHVIKAGFDNVTIHTLDYPSAIAMSAVR